MNLFERMSLSVIAVLCFIVVASSTSTSLQARTHVFPNSNTIFSHKPNGHLYWQALLQVAKKNKDAALEIVARIQSENDTKTYSPIQKDSRDTIDDFFDHLFLSKVSRNPHMLNDISLFESIGIYEHNAYLNDVSPHAKRLKFEKQKKNLHFFKNYSLDTLSPEQKIAYKTFLWDCKHAVEGEKFLFHGYKINHMFFGVLPELLSIFTQFHPLKTPEHVDLYLVRLGRVAQYLQQSVMLLEHQNKMGIIPPACTLSKNLNILKKLTTTSVVENILYSHLATSIETIELSNKEQVLSSAAEIIKTSVYPACHMLQQSIQTILSQTSANNGVWALPNGDEHYAHQLKYHTTTDMSADEIYELGIQEVQRVQAEIRVILERENLNDNEKTVGQLLQELSKNPQFYYPQTQEGRKQCLDDFRTILERGKKELSHLFDLQPKTPVKLEAVPQYEEEDGLHVPYYAEPSMDGSRPGTFFVNLSCLCEMPKFGMETVTIHEAEPGHHFQISLQRESDLPILQRLGLPNAYVEGWALYTEKLAYEHGFFSSSFDVLGHLQDELLRAVRLVIDPGIHKKRWTREQAIEYMEKNTGFSKGMVTSEVERYLVWPGQACSYKIGQLKILELRQRVKDALGSQFDIRAFHNIILKTGAVPLIVLEEVVDQYIQDKTP